MTTLTKYALLVLLATGGCSPHTDPQDTPLPKNISDAMPKIGKWMYESGTGTPAQWLGLKLNDKTLYEPINLIIVDTISTSDSASGRLVEQRFAMAGFNARPGHTSTYKGKMNEHDFPQLPADTSNKAFSNYLWTFTNDHARLFGPYHKNSIYFWIGAASRERGLSHEYLTFSGAREAFEKQLVRFSSVRNLGKHDLHNTQNNKTDTTGDHDGTAVVLQIQ